MEGQPRCVRITQQEIYNQHMVDLRSQELQKIAKGEDGWDTHKSRWSFYKVIQEDNDADRRGVKDSTKLANDILKDYKKTPLYSIRRFQAVIENGKRKIKSLLKHH